MSFLTYFGPVTMIDYGNAETLVAGKAAAEAMVMGGKDEKARRKPKRASIVQV